MTILGSHRVSTTSRGRFTPVPWHDQHPLKLDIEQQLPADHLAFRIEQAVAGLDLQFLRDSYGNTGSLPFPPEPLLRVVLFQTRRGQHSPATWHGEATENQAVRWLLRGLCPSRSCWYAFRDRIAPLLPDLNAQALKQAQVQGLTQAEEGSLDGTHLAANASRHHLVNEEILNQRVALGDAACAADEKAGSTVMAPEESPLVPSPPVLLSVATPAATTVVEAAATEPTPARPVPQPSWMPRSRQGRRQQQKRLRQAQQRLAALQARNRAKRSSKRIAGQRIVVSLSDPASVAGYDKEDVFRPLYNVQVIDDLHSPLILAYDVFAQPNDPGLMGTMLERVRQLTGHPLKTVLADTAYAGGADLAAAAAAGVTVYAPLPAEGKKADKQIPQSAFVWQAADQTYICPAGHHLEYQGSSQQKRSGPETVRLEQYRCAPGHCTGCPLQPRCTASPQVGRTVSRSEHEGEREALRERMGSAEAKALYRLRSQSVELVNGDWKEHRKLRRFSGRGLARVRAQVGLVVLAHNLLILQAEEKKTQVKVA